jgi:hypothetical protein
LVTDPPPVFGLFACDRPQASVKSGEAGKATKCRKAYLGLSSKHSRSELDHGVVADTLDLASFLGIDDSERHCCP